MSFETLNLISLPPISRRHLILTAKCQTLLLMTVVASKPDNRQLRAEIPVIQKAARRHLESPEKARQFLIKGGFMTKGGKLPKRYGG